MTLFTAIIDAIPPLQVHVARAEDAARLATLTRCRVRIETVFEPSPPETPEVASISEIRSYQLKNQQTRSATTPEPSASATLSEKKAPSAPPRDHETAAAAIPRTPKPPADTSLSEKIYTRIVDAPRKVFRIEDFADLGRPKAIRDTLHRLATRQRRISHCGPGKYQALRQPLPQGDAPITDRTLDFLRLSPGVWFKTKEVLDGLGLPEERRPTVASALNRLVAIGKITRKEAGSFSFLPKEEPPH